MSSRKAVAIRRAEFACEVIDATPSQSRARELVESGLLDRAAMISELARTLTDAAIEAMQMECAAEHCLSALGQVLSLRHVAFQAIAGTLIERLDRRR